MKLHLRRILKEIEPYRERKAKIDPNHAALLAIDLQNHFSGIAQPVLENIREAIETCRRAAIPILFTQHGHSDRARDGGMLARWWDQLIMEGTEDWKFLPEISVESHDIVLPKKRYSAFMDTDLDKALRSRGIQDVIISGVMTNLCCETTARDAFMRDYRVFFLIDGTATASVELHVASVKNLGYGFAYLLTCHELVDMLTKMDGGTDPKRAGLVRGV